MTKSMIYDLLLELEVEAAYRSRLRDRKSDPIAAKALVETEAKVTKLENQILGMFTEKERENND